MSAPPRFYLPSTLETESSQRIDGDTAHYICRVLRLGINDTITLFNGQGGEFLATITTIEKKSLTVEINCFIDREAESPLDISLAQVIAKGDKVDYLLQKSTELGVSQVTLLTSRRSEIKLTGERLEKRIMHWNSIIQNACNQCGRNICPTLIALHPFESWITSLSNHNSLLVFLDPGGNASLSSLPILNDQGKASRAITLIVGPEGGFSDTEMAAAKLQGAHSVKLGPRVLRTETAALAAISTVQALWGDF